MRCLYEVLAVDRDADDAAIKVAYRRGALEWHPDKNQDRQDEAADRFKEIQNAYEVLSDKHERAWYDSHRDAILRSGSAYQAGGDGGGSGQAPDSEFDLYPFFSAACYRGYGDGPHAFYGVYSDVFTRLATAEREAVGPAAAMPAFGDAAAPWAAVSAFYGAWTAFSTAKDFAWADEYNPASAPNRKVRRLMEDDNRKRRAKARREFNETVRELAAFVRKRDKRVAAAAADAARAKAAREQEAAAQREAAKRERAARAQAYQEAAWVRGEGDEGGGGDGGCTADGTSSSGEDADEPAPLLHCLACDKLFRSAGAMANHERSKKHAEAVARLRAELEEEEAALAGSAASSSSDGGSGGGDDDDATTTTTSTSCRTGSVEDASSSSSSSPSSSSSSSSSSSDDDDDDDDDGSAVDDDEFVSRLMGGRQQRGRVVSSSSSDESSSEEVEAAAVEDGGGGDSPPIAGLAGLAVRDEDEGAGVAGTATAPAAPAAPAPAAAKKKRGRRRGGPPEPAGGPPLACRVCGHAFASRTALFKHLSETGHAQAGK